MTKIVNDLDRSWRPFDFDADCQHTQECKFRHVSISRYAAMRGGDGVRYGSIIIERGNGEATIRVVEIDGIEGDPNGILPAKSRRL